MRHILIVESDEAICLLLKDVLRESGFAVHTAQHASEALESIHNHPPDVILVDLAQPDDEGWAFLESCRQQPGCGTLPVAVMSTTLAERATESAARARGYGWIAKPFLLEDLLRVLEELAAPAEATRDSVLSAECAR